MDFYHAKYHKYQWKRILLQNVKINRNTWMLDKFEFIRKIYNSGIMLYFLWLSLYDRDMKLENGRGGKMRRRIFSHFVSSKRKLRSYFPLWHQLLWQFHWAENVSGFEWKNRVIFLPLYHHFTVLYHSKIHQLFIAVTKTSTVRIYRSVEYCRWNSNSRIDRFTRNICFAYDFESI